MESGFFNLRKESIKMKDPLTLKGKRLIVRNFDWSSHFDAVCRWNADPEVLKYIEEDEVKPRTRDETKTIESSNQETTKIKTENGFFGIFF